MLYFLWWLLCLNNDTKPNANQTGNFLPLDNMVQIPAGKFTMGSNNAELDEQPAHELSISSFYLCKYEVTVAEFKTFVEASGYQTDAEKTGGTETWKMDHNGFERPNSDQQHPVMHVSWNDAMAYCKWLSQKTGKTYRLPTEAEWEYVAGNGAKHTKYDWGNGAPIGKKGGSIADEQGAAQFGWTQADYMIFLGYKDGYEASAPVGSFSPNELGICDLSGNLSEWCQDWYSESYYPSSPASNPKGPTKGSEKVIRGGSWGTAPADTEVHKRDSGEPGRRGGSLGFRVARDL